MRVYFDTSCICRPLDDRSIPRNAVEREAILAILLMRQRGELSIVISDVVLEEIDETPDETRRMKLWAIARVFPDVVELSTDVLVRGQKLRDAGFKDFDALHIAAAEKAGVGFFCTGDDRLKRRGASYSGIQIRIVSPLELIQELNA